MSRGDLTEEEWHILKILLPVEREAGERRRGRPPEDNRNIINDVLWRLRTGAPWRDEPEEYGNWELDLPALSTLERVRCLGERCHCSRREDGRERTLQHRQLYGSRPCLGSGRKRGIHRRALGRSRGGVTTKVRLADARGRPLVFHLTPGEVADCKAYDTLNDLPQQTPKALLADKGYDSNAIRDDLKRRGIKPVIPPKSNRKVTIRYNKRLYRERNCIERVFGHLKINRTIVTRYDQLAESFLGTLFLASASYWIKFVHAA